MINPDDCPNTNRLLDWMGHCKTQHEQLNTKLNEIHEVLLAVTSLSERLKSHTQRIDRLDYDIRSLRKDVDDRMSNVTKALESIGVRVWKIVVAMSIIVVVLNKSLPNFSQLFAI